MVIKQVFAAELPFFVSREFVFPYTNQPPPNLRGKFFFFNIPRHYGNITFKLFFNPFVGLVTTLWCKVKWFDVTTGAGASCTCQPCIFFFFFFDTAFIYFIHWYINVLISNLSAVHVNRLRSLVAAFRGVCHAIWPFCTCLSKREIIKELREQKQRSL